MSSKMGRPKSQNPLNYEVKGKVDKDTYQKVLAYCQKEQINKTEFVRRGIDLLLNDKKQKK